MALGNLASRFLVALVAAPILIFAIYQDTPHYTWGLVFGASLLTMAEFFAMTLEDRRDRAASLVFGIVCVLALYWLGAGAPSWMPMRLRALDNHLLLMVVAVIGPMLYYVFRFGDMQSVAARVSYTITGIVYAGVLVSFIALVRRDFDSAGHTGADLVIMLLLTAWLADTGGYFAGKGIGGPKLYPAVSPNKTWAGSIGGTLCSIAGGVVFKLFFLEELPWVDIIVLTGVGSIIGQVGDLCESMIKRSTGVKDSGAILPGHGGMLDRVDAVLMIAPFYYLYLRLFGG